MRSAPRYDVRCRSCDELLGRLNRGDRKAPRGAAARILTAAPGVRVFHDLVMGRAELHCPACGACGRIVDAASIRGVVVVMPETSKAAC